MEEGATVDDALDRTQGLTFEEDEELRRLNYLNEIGCLSTYKVDRLLELRVRDRRAQIRAPREFTGERHEAAETAARRRLAGKRTR